MDEDHYIRCQDCMTLLDRWFKCPEKTCEEGPIDEPVCIGCGENDCLGGCAHG